MWRQRTDYIRKIPYLQELLNMRKIICTGVQVLYHKKCLIELAAK